MRAVAEKKDLTGYAVPVRSGTALMPENTRQTAWSGQTGS